MKTYRLLCISHDYNPGTTPSAVKNAGHLEALSRMGHHVELITAAQRAVSKDGVITHHSKPWSPTWLYKILGKLRLSRLAAFFIWPDPQLFWTISAYLKAAQLIREDKYDAIVTFVMPFSSGLIGVALKKKFGLPLVINFADSPTCDEVHFEHESKLHYLASGWLEDFYIKQCDAAVYVNQSYTEPAKARLPKNLHSKIHVVYRGASPEFSITDPLPKTKRFEILYTGGMRGWLDFYSAATRFKKLKMLLAIFNEFGRYRSQPMDVSTHTPIYIGRAIKNVFSKHPDWKDKIHFTQVGCQYSPKITQEVLRKNDLQDIVTVLPPVTHDKVLDHIKSSHMLFMNMHVPPGHKRSSTMSGKTFEYLLTNRPILVAFPEGENRDIFDGVIGVWATSPKNIEAMEEAIIDRMKEYTNGNPETFDRTSNIPIYSYNSRASEFTTILTQVLK